MPENDAPEAEAHAPLAFHAESLKLRFLAVVALAAALYFAWLAINHAPASEDVSSGALWSTGALMAVAAALLWRQGSDPRPVIVVGPDGLRDRFFGEIPWEHVRAYRHHRSLFTPCFGYDLKKGCEPPENAMIWRLQGGINRISGLPARTFRKKLVAGGIEAMLTGFRRFRPDLEGK